MLAQNRGIRNPTAPVRRRRPRVGGYIAGVWVEAPPALRARLDQWAWWDQLAALLRRGVALDDALLAALEYGLAEREARLADPWVKWERERQRERRLRRKQRPEREAANAAERAAMAPYDLGREDAVRHAAAVARYNARPPDRCPYPRGSAEEDEYDRGWRDWFATERSAGASRP